MEIGNLFLLLRFEQRIVSFHIHGPEIRFTVFVIRTHKLKLFSDGKANKKYKKNQMNRPTLKQRK